VTVAANLKKRIDGFRRDQCSIDLAKLQQTFPPAINIRSKVVGMPGTIRSWEQEAQSDTASNSEVVSQVTPNSFVADIYLLPVQVGSVTYNLPCSCLVETQDAGQDAFSKPNPNACHFIENHDVKISTTFPARCSFEAAVFMAKESGTHHDQKRYVDDDFNTITGYIRVGRPQPGLKKWTAPASLGEVTASVEDGIHFVWVHANNPKISLNQNNSYG
jgi:hypothetical protein